MDDKRTTNKLLANQSSLTSTLVKPLTSQTKTTQLLTSTLLSDLTSQVNARKKKIEADLKEEENAQAKKSKLLRPSLQSPLNLLTTKTYDLAQNLHAFRLTSASASTSTTMLSTKQSSQADVKPESDLNVVSKTLGQLETDETDETIIDFRHLYGHNDLICDLNEANRMYDVDSSLVERRLNFIDPFDTDRKLLSAQDSALVNAKTSLINIVSSSLLRAPNFKNPNDPTRLKIIDVASRIVPHDAEFILKLAFYTRKELNIRVTANFLLSFSAYNDECRKYLARYYTRSIVLPSDWIDVAEQYQLFFDKRIRFGALPHSLRKCMSEKFPDFDEYQLAKYNKDKSKSTKNKANGDVKHIRCKLKPNADGDTYTEDKYIKTLTDKSPLKVDHFICIQLSAKENFRNFKIDLVIREPEQKQAKPKKFTRSNKPISDGKKKPAEQVPLRLAYTRESAQVGQKLTKKSFSNKAWAQASSIEHTVAFDKATEFQIQIKVNRQDFGVTINNDIRTSHKHDFDELNQINIVRVSGVGIGLKELKVVKMAFCDDNDDEETEEENRQRTFTLKQLIRQLHIAKPVQHVLGLLGKKYPASYEEFLKSGLPGEYDSTMCNKRLKLPVPETWETQLSFKGNHAHVWEQLIDNKKLPYMAMLRNLRNMIKTGIDTRHHQIILKKLQDEGAVVNSKQFPISFFSAYDVIDELEKDLEKYLASACGNNTERQKSNAKNATNMYYDVDTLRLYKKALDSALKTATTYNISPIKGKSLVLVNIGESANFECKTARIGKSSRSVCDIAILLGLMFKYSCEYSSLVFYDSIQGACNQMEQLKDGTILDNMKSVLESRYFWLTTTPAAAAVSLVQCLNDLLSSRVQYDNVVVLSPGFMHDVETVKFFDHFLKAYRACVNSGLLFVNVDLGLTNVGLMDTQNFKNPNDVCISGYSDSILRFVAERGNQGQLLHVEHIDKSYDLPEIKKPTGSKSATTDKSVVADKTDLRQLSIVQQVPRWRTVKVFISSTFKDMHAERDILSRVVFPLLREKLNPQLIDVQEVDLRWGISESQANNNRALGICLGQVLESDFFIGLLGDRYGYVPDSNAFSNVHSDNPKLAWLEQYAQQEPTDTSITELEIECAAFRKADRQTSLERTFFYFRDNQSFRRDVQADVYREHFDSENDNARNKLYRLKKKILSESFEVFNGYTATWYGMGTAEGISRADTKGNGRAVLCDLNGLAKRVFDNLFNAISKVYATASDNETTMSDETTTQTTMHNNYVQTIAKQFIGRQKLLNQCDKLIKDKMKTNQAHIMVIDGDSGCGKTALICRLGDLLMANDEQPSYVFSHVVGACNMASQYVVNFLRRFEIYANRTFDLDLDETSDIMATNDLGHHRFLFNKILGRLANTINNNSNNNRLFILVDGVDMLVDNNSNSDVSLSWLPDTIPDMVTFILTANSQTSRVHELLAKRASYTNKDNWFAYDHVALPELDITDKSELVRDLLGRHNKALNETGFNNQMRLMTSKRDAHSPLYLTLACEELRLHNNYDTLGQKLKDMPARLALFIPYVLGRLEADFGPLYVSNAFVFILCAKDDLHVYELKAMLDICLHLRDDLANDADLYARIDKIQSIMAIEASTIVHKHLSNTELKFRTFVQSIRATFLKSQPMGADYISLRPNPTIEGLIRSKYAKSMSVYDSVHKLMAIYYWFVGKPIETRNPRAFVCLPYHLCASGLFGDLVTIVCELKFLSTKCMLGLGAQVLDDFDLHRATTITTKYGSPTVASKTAVAVAQQVKHLESRRFIDYKAFMTTNYHILSTCPSLFYQQVFNEPSCTVPVEDLTKIMAANREFRNDNVSFVFKMLNKDDRGDDGPTVRRLNDFTHAVTAMAVSPNGQYLTCGTDNCQIRVYLVATGKLVRMMHGHSGRISDLCFLDDDTLCSTSNDGIACLWNFGAGYRIRILNKHNGHVVGACVAQPGTGKKLITVGWDCSIRIWNKADGNYDGEIKGHGRPINCCAFHPDGHLIATGCWDACLRLFHLDSRQRKAVLRGHLTSIRSVAYAPNGVYLASAAIDGDVILWNSNSGIQVSVLKGHKLPVNCLRYTDNGNLLVTCSNDRKTKVWSGTIGKMVRVIRCQQQLVRITSVCFNHRTEKNVKTMAVGLSLGDIRIYDTDGNLRMQYNLHNAAIVRLRFTTDGNCLVSTAENGSVYVTVVNCSTHRVLACLNGSTKSVNGLAISCIHGILTGSEDCLLRYYGDIMTLCDEDMTVNGNDQQPSAVYSDHVSPITACVYNGQGTRLVSVDKDATIIFWRAAAVTGALAVDFKIHKAHMDMITDCDWSNTSDFIVTASNDFNLKIWDAMKGTERVKLVGHTASISKCIFQYGCIVSSCVDGSLKVWSHKGHEITTLRGHQGRVNCCDIVVKLKRFDEKPNEAANDETIMDWAEHMDQNDQQQTAKKKHDQPKFDKKTHELSEFVLVSVSDDQTIRIWKPLETDSLLDLNGHNKPVNTLALGGSIMCTGGSDNLVNTWHLDKFVSSVRSGNHSDPRPIRESHKAEVTSICLSKAVDLIFSSSVDGTIMIWKLMSDGHLKLLQEVQVHEKPCIRILVLDDDKQAVQIATCSDDGYVKFWSVKVGLTDIDVTLQAIRREFKPVKHIALLDEELGSNYMLAVSVGFFYVQINFYDIKMNWKKILGYNLIGYTSFLQEIRMFDKYLYMTDIDRNVYCIDVTSRLKTKTSDVSRRAGPNIVKGNDSTLNSNDFVVFEETDLADTVWYTSVVHTNGNCLNAVCSNGYLHRENSKKFNLVKKLHNKGVTQILKFEIGTSVVRLLSASYDGTVKIWSDGFAKQLGQFNFNFPITSACIIGIDANQVDIVCADQMGFMNLLRWFDN